MAKIGPGLKEALLEAFNAAAALLPRNLRNDLVLIGGTSLLSVGGNRKTNDVDIAVKAAALHAFHNAAQHDPRFREGSVGDWRYTSRSGIVVPLEFLAQGDGFVPIIKEVREIDMGGGMRAGLGELAIMKAQTWMGRDEENDLDDFKFLLLKMEERGENFLLLLDGTKEGIENKEVLKEMEAEVEGVYRTILQKKMTQ